MLYGRRSAAFTLLEVLIVVVLIGVAAAIVVPRLKRMPTDAQWQIVVDNVNNMITFARQEAMATQKTHRLMFKAVAGEEVRDTVLVQAETGKVNKQNQKIFEDTKSDYVDTRYNLSKYITITGVFLSKKNMLNQNNDGQAFCYITSSGLVQQVYVQLTRLYQGDTSKITLRIEPFLGTCELLDDHVKP